MKTAQVLRAEVDNVHIPTAGIAELLRAYLSKGCVLPIRRLLLSLH